MYLLYFLIFFFLLLEISVLCTTKTDLTLYVNKFGLKFYPLASAF